ncbi:MAG: ABC transporter ATP-binding protein [Lachnospiraceae bacterium]|nr:ABC transporter ATP-binding protein [Lachnospiraceae bacterium]
MGQREIILHLEDVVKCFGGITASNHIDIQVPKNSIYGIIGPNGAGKTTLFNMITGVYDTTEGQILFQGSKINGLPTHVIAQKGIARTFQNIRLFGDLSVYDNLLTACQQNISYSLLDGFLRTSKCRKQEKEASAFCEELLKEVGLWEQRNQRASNLPYGMQRRLEIARALATKPQLLLLDEPAAGMNEEESAQLSDFVCSIRDQKGITIVIIDHHMDVIMSICDRMTVLSFGTLLAEGNPDEIQNNPDVIAAYLGVDESC